MAKATAVYYGHDTFARSIEVAMREDGVCFSRVYQFNGFCNAWSKWELLPLGVVHPKRMACKAEYANAPEYIDVPEAEQKNFIEWGFNVLTLEPAPYRVRLPQPKE